MSKNAASYRFLPTSVLGNPLKKQATLIVGGGISGLLLAYHLRKKGVAVKIMEANERVGGLLNTLHTPQGLIETAANGILWSPALQALCDDLKVSLLPPNLQQKKRYIVRGGHLQRFPLSVGETAAALWNFIAPHREKPQTMEQFGSTFLGMGALRYLLEPAFGGIYAATAQELSFPLVLPSFAKALNEHRSLAWGLWQQRDKQQQKPPTSGTWGFKGGMGEWVQALYEHLKNDINLNAPVGDIPVSNREQIVLCTPAPAAANLLKNSSAAALLEQVQYASIVSITLFYPLAALPRYKGGFGCLAARSEGLNTLGILFNSSIFEQRTRSSDMVSLTCIFRDMDGTLAAASDAALVQRAEADITAVLGATQPSEAAYLTRWQHGIPIYSPTLYEQLPKLSAALAKETPSLRLFGNYTGHIAIRNLCEQAAQVEL
ncbi:MAG: FAD-dependent oxidoreductase [Sphingobacteriales bacterium]|nr:FAD-dependent oxidoreductase [Sphingobacteriales bacterium]